MSASPHELRNNSPLQMAEVIAGLLQGRTVADIAETVGIPRYRITRWFSDETFKTMLEETSDEVVAAIRAEVVSATADRMVELIPQAVDVLTNAMEAGKVSEQITAAAHVMRFAGMGRKAETRVGPSPEELIRGARGPAAGD